MSCRQGVMFSCFKMKTNKTIGRRFWMGVEVNTNRINLQQGSGLPKIRNHNITFQIFPRHLN